MFSLSDKVAIVTGASRGIGKVIAQVFAMAGAHVVCVARSEDAIKSLADEINANDGSASHVVCDISDGEAFTTLIKDTAKEQGKLDVLINNAAIMASPLARDARGYEMQFATNHLGHFQLTARLWPLLLTGSHSVTPWMMPSRALSSMGPLWSRV